MQIPNKTTLLEALDRIQSALSHLKNITSDKNSLIPDQRDERSAEAEFVDRYAFVLSKHAEATQEAIKAPSFDEALKSDIEPR